MHYHNIILFFEPALVLVDLAFERFDREIDRLLETFAPALGHQVVSRNMEVDRGDFISEFVVFIQFQYAHAEMPVTMVRMNLVQGIGPVMQIAEGWTVVLDDEMHKILDQG